jgi:putative endonuclease
MQRGGTVYMMTSLNHHALYTGVTTNLIARIQQHQQKVFPYSFTARYHCVKLVYYKSFATIEEAILEEKRIKGGSRKQKEWLIASMNPGWKDLWPEVSKW